MEGAERGRGKRLAQLANCYSFPFSDLQRGSRSLTGKGKWLEEKGEERLIESTGKRNVSYRPGNNGLRNVTNGSHIFLHKRCICRWGLALTFAFFVFSHSCIQEEIDTSAILTSPILMYFSSNTRKLCQWLRLFL